MPVALFATRRGSGARNCGSLHRGDGRGRDELAKRSAMRVRLRPRRPVQDQVLVHLPGGLRLRLLDAGVELRLLVQAPALQARGTRPGARRRGMRPRAPGIVSALRNDGGHRVHPPPDPSEGNDQPVAQRVASVGWPGWSSDGRIRVQIQRDLLLGQPRTC